MLPNPQFSANLVTFTEEIFNRNLYFLRSDYVNNIVILSLLSTTNFTAVSSSRCLLPWSQPWGYLCMVKTNLNIQSSYNPWPIITAVEGK